MFKEFPVCNAVPKLNVMQIEQSLNAVQKGIIWVSAKGDIIYANSKAFNISLTMFVHASLTSVIVLPSVLFCICSNNFLILIMYSSDF